MLEPATFGIAARLATLTFNGIKAGAHVRRQDKTRAYERFGDAVWAIFVGVATVRGLERQSRHWRSWGDFALHGEVVRRGATLMESIGPLAAAFHTIGVVTDSGEVRDAAKRVVDAVGALYAAMSTREDRHFEESSLNVADEYKRFLACTSADLSGRWARVIAAVGRRRILIGAVCVLAALVVTATWPWWIGLLA